MLELVHLVKHYPAIGDEPVRAVDDVSLTVGAGELVALYGPSGSGKTSLLKLVAGVMRPDRGRVLFDGRDVGAMTERESARYRLEHLGFVLQSFHLIAGLSAIDNAALKLMGMKVGVREAQRRVTPLLERLELASRADHRASDLSMGERQRVVIAKALSTEPAVVLADEPTASLDTRRGHDVLTMLSEICREHGTAVIIVTHDPRAAAFADRVHTLRDGRLTEYDPAAHVGWLPAATAP